MGLIQVSTATYRVLMQRQLWTGKNRTFKRAWCKNLYTYCGIVLDTAHTPGSTLTVLDMETGNEVATWCNDVFTESTAP